MDEGNAYALLREGNERLEDGDHAGAVAALEKARACEPGRGSILEALGRAYFGRRSWDRAAQCFAEALAVDPANDYAHYCLGLCYLKLGRDDEAAGHFKVAWYMRPCDTYRAMAERSGVAAEGRSPGRGG